MTTAFDLNLKHLRALPLIAQHKSLSAAADAVGLSQPALTQGLAKLEAQFGVALFERRPHGVVATGSGERVLVRVERALRRFGQAMRAGARGTRRGARPENALTATHVRALLSFADAGSFVSAAQAVGLSEPAVHRAVRQLEELSGAVFVERRGRGVGLTDAGRRIAGAFALAVTELDAALEESTRRTGRLSIGAMALSRSVLVPTALAQLSEAVPQASIDVVEGSYIELVEFLRSGSIDIIIGALREQAPPDLRQEKLFVDRLAVIGRTGHPLAGTYPGTAELARFPWIIARRASPLLERWQKLFDEAGVPRPRAPIRCGSVTAIRGLLVRSDFLTLLSRDQVRVEIEGGLLTPIATTLPETVRTIGAITRRDWHPTALQQHFMELLRRTAAETLS